MNSRPRGRTLRGSGPSSRPAHAVARQRMMNSDQRPCFDVFTPNVVFGQTSLFFVRNHRALRLSHGKPFVSAALPDALVGPCNWMCRRLGYESSANCRSVESGERHLSGVHLGNSLYGARPFSKRRVASEHRAHSGWLARRRRRRRLSRCGSLPLNLVVPKYTGAKQSVPLPY